MQTTFIKNSITAELAKSLIDCAIKAAAKISKPMVIAIVDESGILKAYCRMDGAALVSVNVAQMKAYTAVANARGEATHEMNERVKNNHMALAGMAHIPGYTLLGGGFPIKIDEVIVGAIGVSGGTAEEDMLVAREALEIILN